MALACASLVKRIVIPVYQRQVAPVLDYCGTFLLLVLDGDIVKGRLEIPIDKEEPEAVVRILKDFRVDVVICGAVSGSLLDSLASKAIETITCVCGPVECVVAAYLRGTLASPKFRLPGAGKGCR